MSVRMWTMAALVLVTAAGCGGDTVPAADGDGSDGELVGRTFLSEQVTEDGAPRELVEGTRISLEFTGDGQLRAEAGCNILRAEVSVGADRLDVAGVEGTERGCDPARQAQDEWLTEFLTSSPEWALDADRLTLVAGGTELVLRDRRTTDPDRELVGTRWVVDTVVTGEVASSMPGDTEGTAWLVIEDGRFEASTGCREVSGGASVDGGRVRFEDAVQTDPACPPELADVDDVMLAVLTGEVDYSIEASRLRLDHPDGVGLGLQAGE